MIFTYSTMNIEIVLVRHVPFGFVMVVGLVLLWLVMAASDVDVSMF